MRYQLVGMSLGQGGRYAGFLVTGMIKKMEAKIKPPKENSQGFKQSPKNPWTIIYPPPPHQKKAHAWICENNLFFLNICFYYFFVTTVVLLTRDLTSQITVPPLILYIIQPVSLHHITYISLIYSCISSQFLSTKIER